MGYKFKTLSEMEPWEKQYLENIRVIEGREITIYIYKNIKNI